ncbi:MAG: transglutaminase domain-containing protein [Treponema sp.]
MKNKLIFTVIFLKLITYQLCFSFNFKGIYQIPENYDESKKYRTYIPDETIKKILKDKSLDELRTKNTNTYVKNVCDIIQQKAQNDFEKVKMAHDFTALLITYDTVNFLAGTIPEQDYVTVLKSKTAVCEGYSNVFLKFCQTLKIPCRKIHGYARGVGTSIVQKENPKVSNHAWNMVKIKDVWYFIDTTWDSGFLNGRNYVNSYSTEYLFTEPDKFIYTHYPQIKIEQLLENPISEEEFLQLPDFRPIIFEITEFENKIPKTISTENNLILSFKELNNYELHFVLTDKDETQRYPDRVFKTSENGKTKAMFSLPGKGLFIVNVYKKKVGEKREWLCGRFLIEAKSENKSVFPEIYETKYKTSIISPIESPLIRNKTYTFSVLAEKGNSVAIICGKEIVRLEKNEETQIFTGEFTIPENAEKVLIGIAGSSTARSYEILAKYETVR